MLPRFNSTPKIYKLEFGLLIVPRAEEEIFWLEIAMCNCAQQIEERYYENQSEQYYALCTDKIYQPPVLCINARPSANCLMNIAAFASEYAPSAIRCSKSSPPYCKEEFRMLTQFCKLVSNVGIPHLNQFHCHTVVILRFINRVHFANVRITPILTVQFLQYIDFPLELMTFRPFFRDAL